MSGAPEELRKKLLQEVMVQEDRISVEELELFEKMVETEEIMKERRKTTAEEWRVSDAAGGGVTCKAASGAQGSRAGVAGLSDESRVDVNREGSWEDRSSVSSAGTLQKKRKTVIRNEFCGDARSRVLPGHGGR